VRNKLTMSGLTSRSSAAISRADVSSLRTTNKRERERDERDESNAREASGVNLLTSDSTHRMRLRNSAMLSVDECAHSALFPFHTRLHTKHWMIA
jgi:hypothetical protein